MRILKRNPIILGALIAVIFLGGYSTYRNQRIIYERNSSGEITHVNLRQLGIQSTLIPDSNDSSKFVVQGNSYLDSVCNGIYSGGEWICSKAVEVYNGFNKSSVSNSNEPIPIEAPIKESVQIKDNINPKQIDYEKKDRVEYEYKPGWWRESSN